MENTLVVTTDLLCWRLLTQICPGLCYESAQTKYILTINVTVVYMGRDIVIWMRAISITRAVIRGGHWKSRIFEFLGSNTLHTLLRVSNWVYQVGHYPNAYQAEHYKTLRVVGSIHSSCRDLMRGCMILKDNVVDSGTIIIIGNFFVKTNQVMFTLTLSSKKIIPPK